ncbi:MAG: hypothetical protein HY319_19005 [Armatimonadetes bacterium]|nr:hypothetical protein [Armatimonadota bacterium]
MLEWTQSLVEAYSSPWQGAEGSTWEVQVREEQATSELQEMLPPADQDGNYEMPALVRLRQIFAEYAEGRMRSEEVLEVLDRIAEFTELQIEEMENVEGDVNLEDPGRLGILDGFEAQLQAVLYLSVDIRDPNRVRRGLDLAQKAVNRMVIGYRQVVEDDRKLDTQCCPWCAAESRRGARRCLSCGQDFPTAPVQPGSLIAVEGSGIESEEPEGPTTPNYVRVSQAVEGWRNRALDDSGLLTELQQVQQRHVDHLRANQRERDGAGELPADERQSLLDLLHEIDEAVSANVDALERMMIYFDDGNPGHIEAGFADLAAATDRVLSSYDRARELTGKAA